jgi:hypothetical protein
MYDKFGVVFAVIGASIFYLLSAVILSRRDKDTSHYLFSLMAICSGTSELLAFFEFTGTMELAHFLLKFDLSFLALAAYFYLLFADYFREGFNKKFALATAMPAVGVIAMVHTVMIEKMVWGPYGWVGVYKPVWDLTYGVYTIAYLFIVAVIFWSVYKQVKEEPLRWKVKLLFEGSIVLIVGALINVPLIITIGRVFPIIETALMVAAIIFTIALTTNPKESEPQ